MIQFGRYENLEEVGRGGFATVYKAHDSKLNRPIALKVLHAGYSSDPNFVDRFHQEAQTVASFNHPNIVTIYDYGEEDRQLYIAMEFLSGGDLQVWLNNKGEPLTIEEALPFLRPIASALDYAHKQSVVHRDIKPSNMMLQQTGNDLRLVMTDFGLVKAMESSVALTMTNQMLGSPEYMAPEQADITRADEIGPATDLYAFGIVAYQMLAGQVPFPGHSLSVLNAHVNIPVPSPQTLNENLSPEVVEILLKMLAKAPADRYPTADAFVADLQATVHTAAQSQQREAQVAPLYSKLLAAKKAGNWLEVMTLAAQIEILLPNYKDVPAFQAEAREALESPQQEVPGTFKALGTLDELISSDSPYAGVELTTGSEEEEVRDESEPEPVSAPSPGLYPEMGREQLATREPQKQDIPTWLKWGGLAVILFIVFGSAYYFSQKPKELLFPSYAALGYIVKRPKDDMNMTYVPQGEFYMGSSNGDEDELPIRVINTDAFWIDVSEVTNEQFSKFVLETNYQTYAENEGYGLVFRNSGWEKIKDADWQHPNGPESNITGLDYHPVVLISWYDALTYCEWAGVRLPTEAEWEFAAKGEDNFQYPWGNDFNGKYLNFCDINCPAKDWWDESVDDGYKFTAPIQSYPDGNSWVGISDMAGNVWEWTNDWYDENYYANSVSNNPSGPLRGESKIVRGGSWTYNQQFVRSSKRVNISPELRYDDLGFRCAASAD